MIDLPARVVLVETDGRTHVAARVGRGPLLTSEGCNLDDSTAERELKETTHSELAGRTLCQRCAIPALDS